MKTETDWRRHQPTVSQTVTQGFPRTGLTVTSCFLGVDSKPPAEGGSLSQLFVHERLHRADRSSLRPQQGNSLVMATEAPTPNSNDSSTCRDDELEPTPVVADHVTVGSERILESPHVSEGPGRIANAPVPSVFSDDRGEIHRLRVGHKRINLLYSKAQVMRSGYLHPNNTHDFVVFGKVEVWTLTSDCTKKEVYTAGQYFVTPKYTPHILHFLEDSVVVEWNEPGPFRCWYYRPYRRIIDVQNSLVSQSTGHFFKLVPQDPLTQKRAQGGDAGDAWLLPLVVNMLWMTGGFISGVALGAVLVSRHQKLAG